jgi:hypothetical protein
MTPAENPVRNGVDSVTLFATLDAVKGRPHIAKFRFRGHQDVGERDRHRRDRYGAGTCMDYQATDPDLIAARIGELADQPVSYRSVETDGAARKRRVSPDPSPTA